MVATAAAAHVTATRATPQPSAQPVRRKRKRRLTTRQLQQRQQNETHASRLLHLTLDINDLKQHVRDLLVLQSLHASRSALSLAQQSHQQRYKCVTPAGALHTTQRFFELFRDGYRNWTPLESAFLDATIANDIVIDAAADTRGADAFYEQWRRYKRLFLVQRLVVDSVRVVMHESEIDDACVAVECHGAFTGQLTLVAIRTLFPHILTGNAALLAKTLDQRLVCPTRTVVYFDARGRIAQFSAHTDLLAALRGISSLRLEDVATFLSSACTTSSSGSFMPHVVDGSGIAYKCEDAYGIAL